MISTSAAGLNEGQSATLTWTSENAAACTIDVAAPDGLGTVGSGVDGGFANIGTSGQVEVFPLQSTTYLLSCEGQDGPAISETTLFVSSINALAPAATVIEEGASTTITWDTSGSTNCALTGDGMIANGIEEDGTATVTPTQTSTYTLSCTSVGTPGTIAQSTTVRVLRILSFVAVAGEIRLGQEAVMGWDVEEATACTVTSDVGGINQSASVPAGSLNHAPIEDTTYTLTCQGDEGTEVSAMESVILAVTITSFTATVQSTTAVTFSWSATFGQAGGCSMSDGTTHFNNREPTDTAPFTSVPSSTSGGAITHALTCSGSGSDHVLTLEVWGGNFNVIDQASANEVPALGIITGTLAMSSVAGVTALNGILLQDMGGDVSVSANPDLLSVSLPLLKSVGEDLGVSNNMALTALDLSGLESVPGFLNIQDNASLCQSVVDGICITNCTAAGRTLTGNDLGC
jgi:hypothetical protein